MFHNTQCHFSDTVLLSWVCTALEDGAAPEAIISGSWFSLLKAHKQQICILAFDEVHCLSEW